MKQRTALVVVIGLLAASVLAAVAQGSSEHPRALRLWGVRPGAAPRVALPRVAGATRMRLVGRTFDTTFVDNAPSGTSQGDEVAITGPLTAHGAVAGTIQGHEVVTAVSPDADRGKFLLTFSALLAAGQVTAVGVVRVSPAGPTLIRAAIVGGTGRFRTAGGEVDITPGPNGSTRFDFLIVR